MPRIYPLHPDGRRVCAYTYTHIRACHVFSLIRREFVLGERYLIARHERYHLASWRDDSSDRRRHLTVTLRSEEDQRSRDEKGDFQTRFGYRYVVNRHTEESENEFTGNRNACATRDTIRSLGDISAIYRRYIGDERGTIPNVTVAVEFYLSVDSR